MGKDAEYLVADADYVSRLKSLMMKDGFMATGHGADIVHQTASAFSWQAPEVILATIIFLLTYGLVLTERINRAILAVGGACLLVLLGVLDQSQAFHGIDFNTITLLLGMMIIVAITKESGVFQYMAILTAQKVRGNPAGILISLAVVTAVFSALLDNVTTVLLITPITLLITRELNVNSFPYLFTNILASNIGGSATLIGDPPNIMIGSAAGLSFMDFLTHMAPVAVVVMVVTLVPIYFMFRKQLVADERARGRIMAMSAKEAITDYTLLKKALAVLTLVILGFTVGHSYHMEPATIAMFGAILLLLLDNFHHNSEKQHEKCHHAIAEAEWVTLFFFAGLFVVVYGLEHTGVIGYFASQLTHLTEGNFEMAVLTTLWGAAILSAMVDNIPFVATMIPLIEEMAPGFGGAEAIEPMWWALAFGACLGGNGSLIGASANLVVAGFAERAGQRISFIKFMLLAFPLMILSIIVAHIYIVWAYLS